MIKSVILSLQADFNGMLSVFGWQWKGKISVEPAVDELSRFGLMRGLRLKFDPPIPESILLIYFEQDILEKVEVESN